MLWFAAAWAHTCEDIELAELVDQPSPAVIILGERHGEKADMKRARAVVRALAAKAPVTLAMEAIHEKNQPVIQSYAAGEIKLRKLEDELNWSKTWGFNWKAYKKLVAASDEGVPVVAAGLDLGPKPEEQELELPEGYHDFLMEAMEGNGHEMSDEIKARFATSMAWRDFRIAELAINGWDNKGYLVILVGRGHVEGSMGTNWQAAKRVQVPVISAVLDHGDARCLDGDRVWAE